MKECVCGEPGIYLCQPCQVIVCNEHKTMHEKGKQRAHIFDKLGKKLTTQQLSEFVENLSSKFQIAHECEKEVYNITERTIEKIRNLSMQAIGIIKEKQKHYEDLLKLCQKKRLFDHDISQIERQLGVFPVLDIPSHEFKEIENFYTLISCRSSKESA